VGSLFRKKMLAAELLRQHQDCVYKQQRSNHPERQGFLTDELESVASSQHGCSQGSLPDSISVWVFGVVRAIPASQLPINAVTVHVGTKTHISGKPTNQELRKEWAR
jgi:hypothetical protein